MKVDELHQKDLWPRQIFIDRRTIPPPKFRIRVVGPTRYALVVPTACPLYPAREVSDTGKGSEGMASEVMRFIPSGTAFLVAVGMILLLSRFAPRLGLIDVPRGRKVHDGAIPLTGGFGIVAGFVLPAATFLSSSYNMLPILLGLVILFILGTFDDISDLTPLTKLAAQLCAVLIMILPHGYFIAPGSLLSVEGVTPALIAIPFTCLFLVGTINAVNMIDGLDGLAGGTAAATLGWLWMAAWLSGRADVAAYVMVLLAAIVGFLIFNARHPWRRRASVFMGNGGSMLLGGTIGIFIVWLATDRGEAGVPLPALLWIIVIPAFDGFIVVARRLAEGRNPMEGDRGHGHHLLLDIGLPPASATAVLVVLCAVVGGFGILQWQLGLPPSAIFAMLLVPCALHFYVVRLHWKREKRDVSGVRQPSGDGLPLVSRKG